MEGCVALGVTGPVLRAAGLPWDLRTTDPGYAGLEFEVAVHDRGDCWARFAVRVEEIRQSVHLVDQLADQLLEPGSVMIDDPKIAWPARLSIGPDGIVAIRTAAPGRGCVRRGE